MSISKQIHACDSLIKIGLQEKPLQMDKIRIPLHPKSCFCPSSASPSYPAALSTVFRLLLLAQGYSAHNTGSVLLCLLNQAQQVPFSRRCFAVLQYSLGSSWWAHLGAAPSAAQHLDPSWQQEEEARGSQMEVVATAEGSRSRRQSAGWPKGKR